jgi:hypothetical protein
MAVTKDEGKEPRSPRKPLLGRRGGRTTVTQQMVRKTFWIDRDVEDRLREEAFHSEQNESELVRRALRLYYGLE